jgi:cyclic dehypoxanthinyl futalosine synthase
VSVGIDRHRFDGEESLRLLREAPLGELMRMGHEARSRRHPGGLVTFVVDTNPNYSNICETRCSFCAFCRREGDPDAFRLTPQELAERVRPASELPRLTVLLQGAHDPGISLDDWIAYIRAIRGVRPDIHVHPFSPPEIHFMARREQTTVAQVLSALRHEGIDTIPGGGAEVLCDRVRSAIAPSKCSADEWLSVMEQAHEQGFRTTATLMFGHVESDRDIVEHLLRLRDLQDRTGGFASFIPWSFKPGNSPLSEKVPRGAHPARYVRIIALARLVLDNFVHVQSSWFSESVTAGSLGLLAGADDFGGILLEENVLRTTGYQRSTNLDKVLAIIRRSGFIPARRDSHYEVLETYPS